MEIKLAITIITSLVCCIIIHLYTVEKYNYSILSIGGLSVCFLGTISLLLGWVWYSKGLTFESTIGIIIGIAPYIFMFIRDIKKTSTIISIFAIVIRLAISLLIILVAGWYLFARKEN